MPLNVTAEQAEIFEVDIQLSSLESILTVTSVSPASGPIAGGTPITITGARFVVGATTVTVGGVAATSVIVVTPTTITAITPSRSTFGTVSVIVTTPEGSSTDSVNSRYTYTGQNYAYTGSNQTFTVPANVTTLSVTVAGSVGATQTSLTGRGGAGCIIRGTLTVTAGDTLTIVCGGNVSLDPVVNTTYGGGGYGSSTNPYGSSGGGYSAILSAATAADATGKPTNSIPSGIFVMAGGGGGNAAAGSNQAGAGGYPNGTNGAGGNANCGGGGITNPNGTGVGGTAGNPSGGELAGNPGQQFLGGTMGIYSSISPNYAGAGAGGGGYYGGGSGYYGFVGGGGSSIVNTSAVTGVNASSTNIGTGYVLIAWTV